MLLKIKSDGTVLYSVPESINQGSNLVNSVQVIAPFSKTLTADIAFQLPQGTITEPLFMVPREFSSDNKLNLWTIDIDRTITQYSGTVYFTIRFYTASEDENPPILATVRSSFPVNKAVLPSLPLEPTTETYTNVLSHINDLYLTKVDRFDILDLPEGIDYTENGLKTSSALFTNATFTVSTTVYNGSLLVLANETTSDDITTRIQTEILFAEDIILRRMITIVDSVVTVGDWKNYLEEINEAVSEHNTSLTAHEDIRTAISDEATARKNADIILQENIDAIAKSNVTSVNGQTGVVTLTKSDIELGNVDNTSDLDKPVSTATQTELDGKLNMLSSLNQVYATVDNINGTIRLITLDNTNISTQQFVNNIMISNGNYIEIRSWENGSDGIIKDNKIILTTDTFTHNDNEILDTSTGLTKAEQTLTSEEKSQVQTNIDVYSKTEVDNKVASVYKYKGSVATYEDLPIEDLSVGDVWNVIDTGDNYAWTGTAWDKLGGEVDLSNYLAKDNTTAFTPTGDYNPATKKYADDVANDKIDNDQKGVANGVATLDANIKIPLAQLPTFPTKTIYVDKNRTDTYTEDGTILTPYKTIASAIAYVISLNYDGYINIEINNGIYAETITLESEALKYLALTGKGYVSINPASGNALQSTSNNTNLFALHINNIIFSKPIVLTGANGTTAFTDVMFNNVKFNGTGTITASCINNLSFTNGCYDECNITLNNVNYVYQQGSQLQGDLAITSDSTENIPSQGLGSTLMVDSITLLGSPTYNIVGTGTITLAVTGSRWGVNSAVSIPAGVTIYAYNTFLRGTHTNNGAITLRSGSTIEGYVAGTGTLTITGNDGKFQYYDNTESGLTATDLSSAINEVFDNQLELGETSTTAYAGDKGKTAYDHSQLTSGNPHSVSKSDVGLGNVVNPNTYGNIEVSDNLDDIVYTGFYTCYGSATGAPSEDYSWFVVHLNSGDGTTYAKQIAFAYDGIQYERFKNTTWGAWKQKQQIFAGMSVAVEDFVANATYSMYPYRASIAVTGMLNTDNPKVYFSASDINMANANQTNFMVVAYTGGVHIYASALPDATMTIEKIEIIR